MAYEPKITLNISNITFNAQESKYEVTLFPRGINGDGYKKVKIFLQRKSNSTGQWDPIGDMLWQGTIGDEYFDFMKTVSIPIDYEFIRLRIEGHIDNEYGVDQKGQSGYSNEERIYIDYQIMYDGNGGTWKDENGVDQGFRFGTVATNGKPYRIQDNFYSRLGYTQIGWTTNSDGTDDGFDWTPLWYTDNWVYVNGDRGIKDNRLHLYARWKEKMAPHIDKVEVLYYDINNTEFSLDNNSYIKNYINCSMKIYFTMDIEEEGTHFVVSSGYVYPSSTWTKIYGEKNKYYIEIKDSWQLQEYFYRNKTNIFITNLFSNYNGENISYDSNKILLNAIYKDQMPKVYIDEKFHNCLINVYTQDHGWQIGDIPKI